MDGDAILEQFSDFGFTLDIEDPDLMERLEQTMNSFGIDQEDFADELIAHMTNVKKKVFEIGMLDAVEKKLGKKTKQVAVEPSSAKRPALTDLRQPLREKLMKLDTTADSSICDSELDCSITSEVDRSIYTEKGVVPLPEHYNSFALISGCPGNSGYYGRTDSGTKVAEHTGRYFMPNKEVGAGEAEVTLVSKSPSSTYASEKAISVIEEKYQWLQQFAHSVLEANPEIGDYGNPAEISNEPVYIYGELISDGPNSLKLEDSTVCLQCDDEHGTVVKLDLTKLPEFSLFPGQAVCFRGTNEDGNCFAVSQQMFPTKLPMTDVTSSARSISIWSACGPFTWGTSAGFEPLSDLLEAACKAKPDLLILQGPLIDRKNTFFLSSSCDKTYDVLLEQLLVNITQYVKKQGCTETRVLIQPSSMRDATVIPSYPCAEFDLSQEAQKKLRDSCITVISDPCIVRVQGVQVAVTNNEAISHLARAEWYRSEDQENTDRFARLYETFFRQASLLPLHPVDMGLDMEKLLQHCQLKTVPHMLINPSLLLPQIKNSCECLCVNPGHVTRGNIGGTYVKAEFTLAELPQGEVSMADYARVEIVKV